MHNRRLITLLAGTAAIAAAPLAWTQSTDPTVGTGTSTSSTTTEDRSMGTTGTSSSMGGSDQSTSGTGTTTGTTGATNSGTSSGSMGSPSTSSSSSDTMAGPSKSSATSGTTTGTTSGTSSATTPGYSSGAATGPASATNGAAKLQGTDATFLQKAMEGGREEVQNAQVAMRSAQRAEVRNAASMMLEDHQRSNQKLEQLASSKGWNIPAAADTADSDQSRLGAGAAFDDNYLEQEIRHHRETISLYRAQASTGSDPELRQFAQDTLPKLEHHLEMLQGSLSAK